MQHMLFSEVLAGLEPRPQGFAVHIPQNWKQGRTTYGGFSAAMALHAAQLIGSKGLPPLRSMQVSFIGPLDGEIEVQAKVLRRGRNATWMSAEIMCGGNIGLTANVLFMKPIESSLRVFDHAPPTGLVPPHEAEPYPSAASLPPFLRDNFEIRTAYPISGSRLPEIAWWLRAQGHDQLDSAVGLMLIADGLPPAVMNVFGPTGPVSSMTWQVNVLNASLQNQGGWWLMRGRSDYAENGCSNQNMDIWNADGMPIVSGIQSIALFG